MAQCVGCVSTVGTASIPRPCMSARVPAMPGIGSSLEGHVAARNLEPPRSGEAPCCGSTTFSSGSRPTTLTRTSTSSRRPTSTRRRCTRARSASRGEPYLVHPLEVAGILAELKLDEACIVTGLLHDTIEDTLATPEELTELFGAEMAELVDGVTKLCQFCATATATQEEKQAENFRKMIVAMARDIRVILVKLADRTHNMRTLEHMAPEKQQRIAQETLDIYAPAGQPPRHLVDQARARGSVLPVPAARRLRGSRRAGEQAAQGAGAVHRRRRRADRKKLKENRRPGEVSGRFKHLYSIHRKMRSRASTSSRSRTSSPSGSSPRRCPACYEALGIIHSHVEAGARAASRTSSPSPSPTCTSRCTPR